jgi:hypothetical protein
MKHVNLEGLVFPQARHGQQRIFQRIFCRRLVGGNKKNKKTVVHTKNRVSEWCFRGEIILLVRWYTSSVVLYGTTSVVSNLVGNAGNVLFHVRRAGVKNFPELNHRGKRGVGIKSGDGGVLRIRMARWWWCCFPLLPCRHIRIRTDSVADRRRRRPLRGQVRIRTDASGSFVVSYGHVWIGPSFQNRALRSRTGRRLGRGAREKKRAVRQGSDFGPVPMAQRLVLQV